MYASTIKRFALRSIDGDWTRNPLAFGFWWLLPVVVASVADHYALSSQAMALVWAAALLWMGIGCVLNARRCHRLHCYISGPVFIAGAAIVALLGLGVVSIGPNRIGLALWTIFGLVLLSFVPERVWGRYRRHV